MTFDLDRFLAAQDPVIDQVRHELAQGRKRTHWMWFVFPQVAGLGQSAMARRYAIASLDEARAYLAHPVLGLRLSSCTSLVNQVETRSILQILGSPDDMKFRSSMTLFAVADPGQAVFQTALAKYFDGAPDVLTLEALGGDRDQDAGRS